MRGYTAKGMQLAQDTLVICVCPIALRMLCNNIYVHLQHIDAGVYGHLGKYEFQKLFP